MTVLRLKQTINSIIMYAYLQYYRYKLRTNFKFMVKELEGASRD
jgi:hypothetical protein